MISIDLKHCILFLDIKSFKQSNLSLTMSYSREITISELGAYSGGTNEISLILEM